MPPNTRSHPTETLGSLPPRSRRVRGETTSATTQPHHQTRTRSEPVENDDEELYATAEEGAKGKDPQVQILLRKKRAPVQPTTGVVVSPDAQDKLRRLSAGKPVLGASMGDTSGKASQRKASLPERATATRNRNSGKGGSAASTHGTQETIVVAGTPLFRPRQPGQSLEVEGSSDEEPAPSEPETTEFLRDHGPRGPDHPSKLRPEQKGKNVPQSKTPKKGNARPSGNTSNKSELVADMSSLATISKGTGSHKRSSSRHAALGVKMDQLISIGIMGHPQEPEEEEKSQQVQVREQEEAGKKGRGGSRIEKRSPGSEDGPSGMLPENEEEDEGEEDSEQPEQQQWNRQEESDHERGPERQQGLIDQARENNPPSEDDEEEDEKDGKEDDEKNDKDDKEDNEEDSVLVRCASGIQEYEETLETISKRMSDLLRDFSNLKSIQNPGDKGKVGYIKRLAEITHTVINNRGHRLSLEEKSALSQLDEVLAKLASFYSKTKEFESMLRRLQKNNLTQRANVEKCQSGIKRTMKARGYKSDHVEFETKEERDAHVLREKNKRAAKIRNEEIARALDEAERGDAPGYQTPDSVEAHGRSLAKKRRRVTDEEQRWEDERLQKRIRAEQEVEHDDGDSNGYEHHAVEDSWSGAEAEHPIVIDEGDVEVVHVEAFGERHAKARAKEERAARTRDEDEITVLEDHEWEEPEVDALLHGIEKTKGEIVCSVFSSK